MEQTNCTHRMQRGVSARQISIGSFNRSHGEMTSICVIWNNTNTYSNTRKQGGFLLKLKIAHLLLSWVSTSTLAGTNRTNLHLTTTFPPPVEIPPCTLVSGYFLKVCPDRVFLKVNRCFLQCRKLAVDHLECICHISSPDNLPEMISWKQADHRNRRKG